MKTHIIIDLLDINRSNDFIFLTQLI